jgi:Xaa-Pro dipeptidase
LRLDKLREIAQRKNLPCVLVAGEPNVYYYSGFNGVGYLLYCDGRTTLIVSVLEMNRAISAGLPDVDIVVADPGGILQGWNSGEVRVYPKRVSEFVAEQVGNRALGLDLGWANRAIENALREKGVKLEDVSELVRDQRAVKDYDELERITKAGEITAKALRRALSEATPSVTERELAGIIDYYMKKYGAEDYAFPTIVASGPNSAFPHHVPKDERLRPPYLLVDWGAKYGGFCFDSTRTFGLSDSPEFKKYYEAVLEAQTEAIAAVKEGVKASELDSIARKVLSKYGLDKAFHHSLGHGVGIEIHEYPTIGPGSNDVLKEGMVITIEPGIYLRNKFGIRIEDTIIVRKDRAEVLETLDKEYTHI